MLLLVSAAFASPLGDVVHSLHGAGTTNPSKLFWESMEFIEERSRLPLHMTYRAVGSRATHDAQCTLRSVHH